MTSEFDGVNIWVGWFENQSRFHQYFAETYTDDDDPISEFAVDQRQWFYDHDFMERYFFSNSTSLRDALRGASYSASYIDVLESSCSKLALSKINTAVLAFGDAIRVPCSASGPSYKLTYLGKFAWHK